MAITPLLTAIANFGFLIVVAAFLLIRTEGKLEKLTAAIADLSRIRGQIYFILRCAQDGLLVHCPHWSDGRISSHSPATMVSYIQAA